MSLRNLITSQVDVLLLQVVCLEVLSLGVFATFWRSFIVLQVSIGVLHLSDLVLKVLQVVRLVQIVLHFISFDAHLVLEVDGAISIAPNFPVGELRRHVLSKHRRGGSLRVRHARSVNELTHAALDGLHVLLAFLVYEVRLRQMALLAHNIDDLQVLADLLGRWQSCPVNSHLHVFVQVIILLIVYVQLGCHNPIVVNALIVQLIIITLDIIEAIDALFAMRRLRVMLWPITRKVASVWAAVARIGVERVSRALL